MLPASPQKIDLQRLLADLALQLRNTLLLGPLQTQTGKGFLPVLPNFFAPAVQQIRIDLASPRHPRDGRAQIQPPKGGFLELLGEFPSRQTQESNSPLDDV